MVNNMCLIESDRKIVHLLFAPIDGEEHDSLETSHPSEDDTANLDLNRSQTYCTTGI